MAAHMKDHGKTIICTVKVHIPGVTVESMRANTTWTRSTATVSTSGPRDVDTRATGKTASSTVKVNTFCLPELSRSAFGKTASV